MDKFFAMKAFVGVVEAGTFTKAATSLGLSKAKVTRLVQWLEEHLKTLLLHRSTRRVCVTVDGAAYYDHAVRVLKDLELIEASMAGARANPKGQLRVDVAPQVANLILSPSMEDFCARYPDIRIDIGVSEKPVDLVGEHVDCALRFGAVTDPSLVARRIGEVHQIVCASASYLKRFGVPCHPSDLEGGRHRVIGFNARERFTHVLQRGNERYEVTARPTVTVNDSVTMVAAGVAGLGIVTTSAFVAAPHLASGELQRVLTDWSAGVAPVHVVYRPHRHVSAKLRAFIDWTADLFARKQNDLAPSTPRAYA
ncbi:LysR family transcriptional regulator [Piscinibacter sp. XHJ-5]|uniref:LysR family transcriptional regulator n=1 Tax=Piscinibacter sp. XHJ-5 TaxID=3037797 RepID=UPI002452AD14|nr:LysR family transcriptional regulator [Piscinibacter sp. XHJ-5]